jgi:hypothetical protein
MLLISGIIAMVTEEHRKDARVIFARGFDIWIMGTTGLGGATAS